MKMSCRIAFSSEAQFGADLLPISDGWWQHSESCRFLGWRLACLDAIDQKVPSIAYHVALPLGQLLQVSWPLQSHHRRECLSQWEFQSMLKNCVHRITYISSHLLCFLVTNRSQVLVTLKRMGWHKDMCQEAGIMVITSDCVYHSWVYVALFSSEKLIILPYVAWPWLWQQCWSFQMSWFLCFQHDFPKILN